VTYTTALPAGPEPDADGVPGPDVAGVAGPTPDVPPDEPELAPALDEAAGGVTSREVGTCLGGVVPGSCESDPELWWVLADVVADAVVTATPGWLEAVVAAGAARWWVRLGPTGVIPIVDAVMTVATAATEPPRVVSRTPPPTTKWPRT
jgi:hypothetical protein